jgi:hypothetical protein
MYGFKELLMDLGPKAPDVENTSIPAEHHEDATAMRTMFSKLYDAMEKDETRFCRAINILSCFTPSFHQLHHPAEYRRENFKVIQGEKNQPSS